VNPDLDLNSRSGFKSVRIHNAGFDSYGQEKKKHEMPAIIYSNLVLKKYHWYVNMKKNHIYID
jgi:hypothetical protein